jgi:hypothetical protein
MQEATKELIKQTAKPKSKPSSQDSKVASTIEDLKAQFDTARANEDWKSVSILAREISKAERAIVEAQKEVLQKQTAYLRDCFRQAIETAINEVCDNLSEDELKLVEGIWLSRDFGNGDFDVRIVKDRIKGRAKKDS